MEQRNKQSDYLTLRVVGGKPNPPDAGGVAQAFSRIGYRIEEALADLIDNSVDAQARSVLIRFFRTSASIDRIAIVDNGNGMTTRALDQAMKFGGKQAHKETDLGKYGIGLKSASLSQCRSLSLVTRSRSGCGGRRWTIASIERDWFCEQIHSTTIDQILDADWAGTSLAASGTVVIWDDLDRLRRSREDVEQTLTRLFKVIPAHLGLVFHRFISAKKIRLFIDVQNTETGVRFQPIEVEPLDPFSYPRTGKNGYPKAFVMRLPKLPPTKIVAHIWPPKSKETGYRLGGGKVSSRQGFYFYRNDRLIQAGGWNGWRESESEPHSSLARVSVELPSIFDSVFRLKVQKSGLDVPPEFLVAVDALRSGPTSMMDYLRDANEIYRGQVEEPDLPVIAGSGIDARLRRLIRKSYAGRDRHVREVRFRWQRLPESRFFEIDRQSDQLIINSMYRKLLTAQDDTGTNESLTKALLFLLVRDEFDRKRVRQERKQAIDTINRILVSALNGGAGDG